MKKERTVKMVSCLMAALLAAGTVTGCGGSSSAGEETPTLTVLCHSSWMTDAAQAAFDAVEEELNVKFEFEALPEGDAGEQLIFAKYSTDEIPDTLWWQKASLVNKNIGADKFADLSGDWEEEYDEAMLHTSYYEVDGKLIEAPFGEPTVFGICYNKAVFEENGVAIPESFEELRVVYMQANSAVSENVGKLALMRGPLVYCMEEKDNGRRLAACFLRAGAPAEVTAFDELIEGMTSIRVKGIRQADNKADELYVPWGGRREEEQEFCLIPYFLWANRGAGEMVVWIHEK